MQSFSGQKMFGALALLLIIFGHDARAFQAPAPSQLTSQSQPTAANEPPSVRASVQLKKKVATPATVNYWPDHPELAMTPISLERAKQLYKMFADQPLFRAGFVDDGCYARSYLMSYKMEKLGIITTKVLAKANSSFNFMITATKQNINWSWHIVPAVLVRDEKGNQQIYVFDLILFKEPTLLETWWSALNGYSGGGSNYKVTPRYVYSIDNQELKSWSNEILQAAKDKLHEYSGDGGPATVTIDTILKLSIKGPSKAACTVEKVEGYKKYHCDITTMEP